MLMNEKMAFDWLNNYLSKTTVMGFKYKVDDVMSYDNGYTVKLSKLYRGKEVSTGETFLEEDDFGFDIVQTLKKCIW